MKIKQSTMAIAVGVILVGGILASGSMNLFDTSCTDKEPAKISEGEFQGQYNPEEIKGSYTFENVSQYFEVPIEDLTYAFNIPQDINVSELKNKDLKALFEDSAFEIGNGSVKYFVSLYKGLPYEVSEDTYLFESAVEILKDKVNLSEEQVKYLETHTIKNDEVVVSNIDTSTEEENTINGQSTFKDALQLGITEEKIEEIINDDMPSDIISIKDYCEDKGLSYSEIKGLLEEEVNKIN